MKVVGALAVACVCMLAAGCGGTAKTVAAVPTASCPANWKPGWQKVANQLHVPVYCPRWMPNPIDGQIGGQWNGLRLVDERGGYLISFIYQETGSGEVHVNFHRWPGTGMPRCRAENSKRLIACYSEVGGHLRVGAIDATLYTVSRDADQWHLSYLWRLGGATYVVSEHVAQPYTFTQVKRNVTRVLRSLVVVRPST